MRCQGATNCNPAPIYPISSDKVFIFLKSAPPVPKRPRFLAGFAIGDLVHLPSNHRETHTFQAGVGAILGTIKPLLPGLEPDRAIVAALAGVALQAVHDALAYGLIDLGRIERMTLRRIRTDFFRLHPDDDPDPEDDDG